MILYDIDSDEIIKVLNFTYDEDFSNYRNLRRTEMKNISFDVGEESCEYIKDWYLESLPGGKLRFASEYKRDLYITDLKDKQIKLINCFIKSVDDKDTFLTVGIYCDNYIIGDSTTFPELKSLYRNAILSSLGI
jgi:hypothetical protein